MQNLLLPVSATLALLFLATATFQVATGQKCDPATNCKLPDCRCWNDPSLPGGLDKAEVPQIVLLSFGYAINAANEGLYTDIFENVNNPNTCPAKGTFFFQLLNSNLDVAKTLYDRKHEIGVTTEEGTTPTSRAEWLDSFKNVKAELEVPGIPAESILGARAPGLFVGGDDQFDGVSAAKLAYDSSCVSRTYSKSANLLWPYTYDFVQDTPICTIGKTPEQAHEGIWQFLVADLEYDGVKCASPSSCSPLFNTTQQAFDLLFNTFAEHYEGNRAPFVLYIDPLWLTVDYQKEATRQFLEFVRAGFDDTWIITNEQALAWMKAPVALSKINDFKPWQCK